MLFANSVKQIDSSTSQRYSKVLPTHLTLFTAIIFPCVSKQSTRATKRLKLHRPCLGLRQTSKDLSSSLRRNHSSICAYH